MASKTTRASKADDSGTTSKRAYVKQSDVPGASLDEALRVPQAIFNHYAAEPTKPLYVAKALNVDPNGSQFRLLSGAAMAFGLVEGGAQAALMSVTELAGRILRPKEEGADTAAKRELRVLMPGVFGDFLRKYDGHPLPRQDIALNVLEEMGVPRDKAGDVLDRIVTSAQSVGLIEDIRDKEYVSLHGSGGVPSSATDQDSVQPELDQPSAAATAATSPRRARFTAQLAHPCLWP